jgi:ribulose kinase
MIYTVGNSESYLRYFAEQSHPMKGIGGSVWKTFEEAEKYAPQNSGFSVFGVLADWIRDTKPNISEPWHDLLINAELIIIRKPDIISVFGVLVE